MPQGQEWVKSDTFPGIKRDKNFRHGLSSPIGALRTRGRVLDSLVVKPRNPTP